MATATVLAVLIAAAPQVGSSCVSDDNCLVLFVCEFCKTISKATATAPARAGPLSILKATAKAGGLQRPPLQNPGQRHFARPAWRDGRGKIHR
jgi:hypothetical protein